MKYIEKYLEKVLKIKPLGTITTERDVLNKELYGERIYIDGIDTCIFVAYADYLSWIENNCVLVSEGNEYSPINKIQTPIDKIEQKFKVGDWVVVFTTKEVRVVQITSVEYSKDGYLRYFTTEGKWFGNETKAHLLTNKDDLIVLIRKDIEELKNLIKELKNLIKENKVICYKKNVEKF